MKYFLAMLTMLLTSDAWAAKPDVAQIRNDLVDKEVEAPGGSWHFDSRIHIESLDILKELESEEGVEFIIQLSLVKEDRPSEAVGTVAYTWDDDAWQFYRARLNIVDLADIRAQVNTAVTIRSLGQAYSYYIKGEKDLDDTRSEAPLTPQQLESRLHSSDDVFYMKIVPTHDEWGNPFEVWHHPARWPGYSAVIRSAGSDGVFAPGAIKDDGEYSTQEHENDIIWADGRFLRWPDMFHGEYSP